MRLRVFVGRTEKGKPIQVSRTIAVTGQREANRALDELKKEVVAGEHGGSSATLKRQLEEYVGEMPRLGRSPRTIEEARRFVNNVLPLDLGAIPINRLTGRDLDRFYKTLGEEGKSPGTIRRYHAVMSAALSQAVKWSYLDRNPAARATIPKPDSDELQVPSIDDVSKLVAAAMADNPIYGTLIRLAVFTGMRRGELCGLRWSDVEPGVLRVRRAVYRLKGVTGEKTPKSGKPRPVVLAPGSAAVLEQWHSACETRAAGVGGLAQDPYVFSSFPDGSRPLNPDTVSARTSRGSPIASSSICTCTAFGTSPPRSSSPAVWRRTTSPRFSVTPTLPSRCGGTGTQPMSARRKRRQYWLASFRRRSRRGLRFSSLGQRRPGP